MIRIVFVDDQPAVRAGLQAVLRAEPGLVPVGAAASSAEAQAVIERTKPDVVLMDDRLGEQDGFLLGRRVKAGAASPAVVVYTNEPPHAVALAARLAGVDAVVDRAAPPQELCAAIREAARGQASLPGLTTDDLREAGSRLPDADLPILGMAVNRVPIREIAETLGVRVREVARRLERMIVLVHALPASAALGVSVAPI
jgi:DNA-binding NarL/FixJ family response regulator